MTKDYQILELKAELVRVKKRRPNLSRKDTKFLNELYDEVFVGNPDYKQKKYQSNK